MNEFYELYTIFLPEFLALIKQWYGSQFWAWLEYYKVESHVVCSDHNRKILQIPQISHKYHVLTLHDKSDVVSIFEYVERSITYLRPRRIFILKVIIYKCGLCELYDG